MWKLYNSNKWKPLDHSILIATQNFQLIRKITTKQKSASVVVGDGSVLDVVNFLHLNAKIDLLDVFGDNLHRPSLVVSILDLFQSAALGTRTVHVPVSVGSGEYHA